MIASWLCSTRLHSLSSLRITFFTLWLDEADIERICYLVGHHHTYTNIDGIDYQILVEADFLVNFYEDELRQDSIQTAFDKIFRTESGKTICRISYFTEWKDQ